MDDWRDAMKERNDSGLSVVVLVSGEYIPADSWFESLGSLVSSIESPVEIIWMVQSDEPFKNGVSEQFVNVEETVIYAHSKARKSQLISMGFGKSKFERMVMIPAQDEYSPGLIKSMMDDLVDDIDVVAVHRKSHFEKSTKSSSISKSWLSLILNIFSGSYLGDLKSPVFGVKKKVLKDLNLFGELFEILPLHAHVFEKKVRHQTLLSDHCEVVGCSYRTFWDHVASLGFKSHIFRPITVFSALGTVTSGVGFFIAFYLTCLKLLFSAPLANRPLLIFSIMLILLGFQVLCIGLVSEIIVKYYVKNKMNENLGHLEVPKPRERNFDVNLSEERVNREIELHQHISQEYDKRYSSVFSKVYSHFWNNILVSLLPKSVQSVLDCGCGTGILLADLVGRVPKVYGIDPSPDMLDRVPLEISKKCELRESGVEDLALDNDSIEAVICRGALHHTASLDLALEKINHVLKVGGVLILSEPCADSWILKFPRWLSRNCSDHFDEDHISFSSRELELALHQRGFEVKYKRRFGYLAFPLCGLSDLLPILHYLPLSVAITRVLMHMDEFFARIPIVKDEAWHIVMVAEKQRGT